MKPEAVAALDRAVLARDAAIVTGRHHAAMRRQRAVTARQVRGVRQGEIAESGRETVGAMLARDTAEKMQGVVETARQRRVTLAAQHDLGMLEAGTGEGEVIEAVLERRSGDGGAPFRRW